MRIEILLSINTGIVNSRVLFSWRGSLREGTLPFRGGGYILFHWSRDVRKIR